MPKGDRSLRFSLALGLITLQAHTHALPAVAAEARRATRAEIELRNEARLRSMPRAERLALVEKFKAFDELGRAEQESIRALDARIAQLPPADRANYDSVLRRYHQWIQGLGEEERKALKATPPDRRMRLVTQLRDAERTTPGPDATPLFLQVMEFSATSLIESTHQIKAWFDLTPEKRAEIEKLASPNARQKRLAELGQQVKGGGGGRLTKSEEDALLAKIEANPSLKNWLSFPLKKADPTKHEKVRRRMAVNYYYLEHPPDAVQPGRLLRFEAALPSWYRDQYDHLPPEEARRRLTVLYRLVFPTPAEMPEGPAKAGSPTATPRPS
jgi:hypothetical protein